MLGRAVLHRCQDTGSLPGGTLALLCACGCPFLLPHGVSLRKFGLAPKAVLERGELHRLVVPTFLHIDLTHALNNASNLVETGFEHEARVGSRRFALDVAALTLLSNSLFAAYAWLLNRSGLEREKYHFGSALGASGLCFALQVVADTEGGGEVQLSPLGVRLPRCYMPWVSLALSQVLVPRASWAGHVCGVLAGVLYAHGAPTAARAWAWLRGGRSVRQGRPRPSAEGFYYGGHGGRLDGRPLSRQGRRGRDAALRVHLALLAAAFALDVGLARRAAARAAPPPRRAPGIAWPRGWA